MFLASVNRDFPCRFHSDIYSGYVRLAMNPKAGRLPHGQGYLSFSSSGTRKPVASRLFMLATPTMLINPLNIASVMPFDTAAARCDAMQYSQPLVTLTAM